jgi:hypothetical protein
MKSSEVSIISPTFNRPDFLKGGVQSVLKTEAFAIRFCL